MGRYIDTDTAYKVLTEYYHHKTKSQHEALKEALSRVPAADVQEVKHGRWEHLGGDEWFCTACIHVITTEGSWERPWQKYCEECGASMDEVSKDE